MLIILATFSLTQLVCSQFQEMVHGVFLASQSGSGPAGERRGLVSAQQPETKQGWRHLFLLVNANKVLLALVGLCERWYHRPGRSSFLSSSENISLGSGRRASRCSGCHALWSPLAVNLHV